MSTIVGQTNYEINQEGYRQINPLSESELIKSLENIETWFPFLPGDIEYIGILCRERNDYTIIHTPNYNYKKATQEIREILESRGEIMDIIYDNKGDYFQCWVRERRTKAIDDLINGLNYDWKPQVWMFVVFNANDWVIKVED